MLDGKKVAVVVPAYNEETQIGIVIGTIPEFVDRIIIINDCSTDRTAEIVKKYIALESYSQSNKRVISYTECPEETLFNKAEVVLMQMRREEVVRYSPHEIYNDNDHDRIVLINTLKNSKVGGAIAIGYKWCRDHGVDCTAVMAGDAQMDPGELASICKPVVVDGIDYVKGNRLRHGAARRMIPTIRLFGNSVLSALTKVASGYWRVSDTQTGYTAISLRALEVLDLPAIYRNYGMPNDMLIKLNIAHCSLREVPIKPVYGVGEQSKMKIGKVIPTVMWLLIKGFFKRIWRKYFVNDFHPVFLFYMFSLISFLGNIYFFIYILMGLPFHNVSIGTYSGYIATLLAFILFFCFGMIFDMMDNDRLQE